MYLVTKLFDDNDIEVTNLSDFSRKVLNVREQKQWCKENIIYGLQFTNGKTYTVIAYDYRRFDTETDAYDFCNSERINVNNVIYTDYNWFVFNRTYKVWHVSYYVYTETEIEKTYIGHRNSYTPYKQAAKEFKKEDAYIKANTMTKKSRTGKKWCVLRDFTYFQ